MFPIPGLSARSLSWLRSALLLGALYFQKLLVPRTKSEFGKNCISPAPPVGMPRAVSSIFSPLDILRSPWELEIHPSL
jgi:hypothetical protein